MVQITIYNSTFGLSQSTGMVPSNVTCSLVAHILGPPLVGCIC